jgi:hypothetical protein
MEMNHVDQDHCRDGSRALPRHRGGRRGQPYQGSNGVAGYSDHYGLGYSNTARHNPTDTNGF